MLWVGFSLDKDFLFLLILTIKIDSTGYNDTVDEIPKTGVRKGSRKKKLKKHFLFVCLFDILFFGFLRQGSLGNTPGWPGRCSCRHNSQRSSHLGLPRAGIKGVIATARLLSIFLRCLSSITSLSFVLFCLSPKENLIYRERACLVYTCHKVHVEPREHFVRSVLPLA